MTEEKNIRSFIALDIGDTVRSNLQKFQSRVAPGIPDVKWVRPEGIHCTLRFLGNISSEDVGNIHQAMIEAVRGVSPFKVEVVGWGMFPNQRRPRVIWAGLERGKDQLESLFNALEKSLAAHGFGSADRPFKPHLTLGRFRSQKGVRQLLDIMNAEQGKGFGQFTADSLVLFRSKLHPQGAVYSVLQQAPFSG